MLSTRGLARFVLEMKDTTQTLFYRMRAYIEDVAVYKLASDPLGDGTITAKDVRAHFNKKAGLSFSPDDPKEIAAYYGELEAKISKEIAGQDRMIREVLDIHRDLMVDINAKRPLRVVGIVGPTGVGETELAKVLARHPYGRASNSLRIDGTAYMDKANLWKLLGPTVGYRDSEQKGQLIEYLEGAGENGGVILIDEGRWVSPTTGIEYDLSKYIFLLTGNDGQELYHDATDEHLREATWARNNKPERIMEILVKAGVPEPLLGRMASLFWSRPLNKGEMTLVANKLMKQYTLNNEEWESLKKERVRGKTEYQRVTIDGVDLMKPLRPKNKNNCIRSLQKE